MVAKDCLGSVTSQWDSWETNLVRASFSMVASVRMEG